MAASLSLTQLSSGNPVYEKYYRLVDPGNNGRVGASEAALFLKKSGLSDLTLGKIWDLADADRKGWLDKQGFYVALRLVACAQNGHEIALSALSHVIPPPAFQDTGSPQLGSSAQNPEAFWVVKPDEKTKFDGIFDSLGPANGLLSGEKVKPVLINSNLPMEVLGKVWDLSDIDKDGHLDRDEFAVAMHLVYRALDKEPVPSVIPPKLVPPAKRPSAAGGGGKHPGMLPGAVPVLPSSPPPPRDSLRSTPSHGSVSSLASGGSLSPKLQPRLLQQTHTTWVVTPADKIKYDEIFLKTDLDMDGFVSGLEVKDIFMQSGLPQAVLAQIWALADTRQQGKLTQDQFALAMYLITQKVSKGVDPPATLSADMMPPSERGVSTTDGAVGVGSADFSAIKELDAISAEITELQREKASLEQDIREKEEAIRYQTNEVQDVQGELDRETNTLQEMQSQNQGAQERLGELEQQRAKLEAMLSDLQLKCQEETQTISSLRVQIAGQESALRSQEDDLSKAKGELSRLQHEENQMEQRLEAGKAHLETIVRSLQATQQEISQVRGMLAQLTDSQGAGGSLNGSLDVPNAAEVDSRSSPFASRSGEDPFHSKAPMFPPSSAEGKTDPFQKEHPFATESVFKAEDPFKGSDPFQGDPFAGQESIADPFGEDPFKGSDPFGGSSAVKPGKSSLATTTTTSSTSTPAPKEPFGKPSTGPSLFASSSSSTTSDPFLKVTAGAGGGGGGGGGRSDPFSKPGASSADLFSRAGSDADPFRSKSAGPFSKAIAEDPFSSNSSDPFNSSTTSTTKADPFKASDPFAPGGVRPTSAGSADPFSSLDPFGSSTFDSQGFADFGNSSRPGSTDPFSDSSGGAAAGDPFGSGAFGGGDDPFRSREAVPNLPPKRSAPPRPKPPSSSGTSTPTKRAEASDASLPFQPFGGGTDPFHSRGGFEEEGCGRTDPFSATQPAPGKSSKGFGFGSESDQMAWATWESERAERERLDRLKRQEQEDLELAIALSKSEMSKP
ncbi:epidermal growth factor receptor substrate 15-like 1 isoform X1 [Lampetra planeri]